LKTFQIVLIGWIKDGPPKIQFCFDHVNRLLMLFLSLGPSSLPVVVAQQLLCWSGRQTQSTVQHLVQTKKNFTDSLLSMQTNHMKSMEFATLYLRCDSW